MDKNSLELTESVSLLKAKAKEPKDVISSHKIWNIVNVGMDILANVEFSTFKVRRYDGRFYEFSEADFPNLDVQDLEILYGLLRDKVNRTEDETRALRAVVRFVQKQLRYNYLHDLQRGIESKQKKVYLRKPKQNHPGLADLKVPKVLTHPVHGVVYMKTTGEKRFLRVKDIPAYSDGTLIQIRHRLSREIATDMKKPQKDRMKAVDRTNMEDMMKLIDDRVIFRQVLRRLEGLFDRNKK